MYKSYSFVNHWIFLALNLFLRIALKLQFSSGISPTKYLSMAVLNLCLYRSGPIIVGLMLLTVCLM